MRPRGVVRRCGARMGGVTSALSSSFIFFRNKKGSQSYHELGDTLVIKGKQSFMIPNRQFQVEAKKV